MTFKDNDDQFFFKVFAVLVILGATAFSCARQADQAPKVCEARCEAEGAKYDQWDFKYLVFVECNCVKN